MMAYQVLEGLLITVATVPAEWVSGWSSPVDRRQVRALGAEEISEVSAYF
jgi:hypothetical protein